MEIIYLMKLLMINSITRVHDKPKHVALGQLQLLSILERDIPKLKFQYYDANAHRVDDFNHNKMDGLEQVLQGDNYDVVAIGGLITAYNYVKLACKTIKEMCPETKIVCGGGIISGIPNDMMTLIPEIDVGVIGESYITFPILLQNMDNYQNIKGIIYRNTDKNIMNASRPLIPDLDWIPFPRYDLAPLDIYFQNSSILMSKESMQSKRRLDACFSMGCPFQCKYCWELGLTSNTIKCGRPNKYTLMRHNSAKYVADYIFQLKHRYKIDFVSWLDENILAHDVRSGGQWLKDIEEEFSNYKINVGMGGTAHPALCTPKNLATMKRIGFTYLDYGLESFSLDILKSIGKGTTPELNKKAIKMTLEAGITPIPNQMIMFPNETMKTINEMLDAWEETGIVSKPFLVTAYPGSEWFMLYREKILGFYDGSLHKFLCELGDATSLTALITDNFTPIEAIGIQQILVEASVSQNFGRARKFLNVK